MSMSLDGETGGPHDRAAIDRQLADVVKTG